MIVVMGDLNAKVGNNNADGEDVEGKFDVGVINDQGERSCDIHNLTWRSPDGRKVNQIDHGLMNGNMKRSTLDTRVIRGANVYSDHISKLQSEEIRWRYNIELRNRFEALGDRGSRGRTTMILSTYSKPWIGNKPWEKSRRGKRRNWKWKVQD